MGTVFRKTFTKPLPAGAETFVRKGERFARWKDRKGKTRTAPLTVGEDGSERIIIESPFYVAKWRDGAGVVRTEATGCRDETAARQVLADLERRAELVRSGVMTGAEAAIGDHQAAPFAGHLDAYLGTSKPLASRQDTFTKSAASLGRLADDCRFGRLADLDAALERWLVAAHAEGMAAPDPERLPCRRDGLLQLVRSGKPPRRQPVRPIAKANEDADRRRTRRAMTMPSWSSCSTWPAAGRCSTR